MEDKWIPVPKPPLGYKRITDERQVIGKTIQSWEHCRNMLGIVFTDHSCIVLGACYLDCETLDIGVLSQYDFNIDIRHDLGIMSDEHYQEAKLIESQKTQAAVNEREKAEYARLKLKFGGE